MFFPFLDPMKVLLLKNTSTLDKPEDFGASSKGDFFIPIYAVVCCDAAVGIDGKTCHELSKCAEVHVMHAKGDFLTESESYAMIQTSFIYCRRSRIIYPHKTDCCCCRLRQLLSARQQQQHKLFYPINYNWIDIWCPVGFFFPSASIWKNSLGQSALQDFFSSNQ